MISVRTSVDSMRWLTCFNSSGVTIPAFGVVRPWFYSNIGRRFSVNRFAQITTEAEVNEQATTIFLNGPTEMPASSIGICTADFPAYAAYDTADGTPAIGEEWGVKDLETKIRKVDPSLTLNDVWPYFKIAGSPVNGRVPVVRSVRDRIALLDTNYAIMPQGDLALHHKYAWSSVGAEVDTTLYFLLSNNFQRFRTMYIILPSVNATDDFVTVLSDWLNLGRKRLVLFGGAQGSWATENAVVNDLLTRLSASISLGSATIDVPASSTSSSVNTHRVMTGVTSVYYYNTTSTSGGTWLAKTSATGTAPNTEFMTAYDWGGGSNSEIVLVGTPWVIASVGQNTQFAKNTFTQF